MDKPIPSTRRLLPLHLAALEFARDMIGVKESSPNWGPEIQRFLRAARVVSPAPWCAAFVNWAAEQAASLLGVPSPLEEVKLQAYVPSYYQWAKEKNKLTKWPDVGPGDLFVIYYASMNRFGHIGFVDYADANAGTFKTIEGNTDAAGGREGNAVASRIRRNTPMVEYIRWS